MIGVIASVCSTALSFPAAAEEAAMETILAFVDMIAQLEVRFCHSCCRHP